MIIIIIKNNTHSPSPIMTHYYPELHHNKYELEDGRTPGGGLVRYGFDQSVFPGFSWKGYAIFSELQVII